MAEDLRVALIGYGLGGLFLQPQADRRSKMVGVQRDRGPLQHPQQFRLVGMQPLQQQAVEHHKAGTAGEDALKARLERASAA